MIAHGLQRGGGWAEIWKPGHRTKRHRGIGQTHIFEVQDEVIQSRVIDILSVDHMDPFFDILVYLLNIFFSLLPVHPKSQHFSLDAIFDVGNHADSENVRNIGQY
jgi:hypothetical protein